MKVLDHLTRGERALVIDFAAGWYGWDHHRVGGDLDVRSRRVYVGSNYAGTFRSDARGDTVLVLDAQGSEKASVRLAAILAGTA